MLSSVAFLAVLMSGSFFAAAYSRRRFEEILPVTCMSIVLILFGFGLVKRLEWGVAFVVIAACSLYAFSIVEVLHKKGLKSFISSFFTPAFLIFCVMTVVLTVGDYGMMASLWDEFSHWMDSVKAMVYINDFHTNQAAAAIFPSYPPAMALMQYFFQKLNHFFNPAQIFSEWRQFFAYQVFLFAMCFPFFRNLDYKRPWEILCVGLLLMAIPLTFFGNVYYATFIDPFVGMLAGCGFAGVLLMDGKDRLKLIYITLICTVLALAKDVGAFFAAVIALAFCFEYLYNIYIQRHTKKPKEYARSVAAAAVPAIGLALAKILWKYVIRREHAWISFDSDLELAEYTKMFFLQSDATYKQTVVEVFKDRFFSWSFYIGNTNIVVSFFTLFLIFVLLLYLLSVYMVNKQNKRSLSIKFTVGLLIGQLVLYIYSLGATYVSNFDPTEAVQLASYARYMSIAFLSVWLVLVLGVLTLVQQYYNGYIRKMCILGLTVIVLICSPTSMFAEFINRDSAKASQKERLIYTHLTDQVQEYCDGNDKICLVTQKNYGYDWLLMKFNFRPNRMSSTAGKLDFGERLADHSDFATPEEWMDALLEDDFDYVAVFDADNVFFEKYASIFEDPANASEQTLYRINKETRTLQRCQ